MPDGADSATRLDFFFKRHGDDGGDDLGYIFGIKEMVQVHHKLELKVEKG